MQSFYPERFERDMGTTEAEWLAALPRAIGPGHPWAMDGDHGAVVQIGSGTLRIGWSKLPERRIALLVMQRLGVSFEFRGLDAAQRLAFMKPFDLAMQRGGG